MAGEARYLEADRSQLFWDMVDLEGLLPPDHRARVVWAFVGGLDLSGFYDRIRAREGEPGRPAADPKVLLGLWLYATLDGVGSARQLERLCGRDVAYRWLAGGVPVNYHGLSDFRFAHGDLLDRLLTESLAALASEGVVTLDEVAIDGTKVRASAGRGSFRGAGKLAALEARAAARVAALKAETEADPAGSERRRAAAQRRAAAEVARRAAEARRQLEKLEAEKAKRAETHKKDEAEKGEARVSVTDPEARLMRFSDGAVRAAYNVQLAIATGSQVIVAAKTTDRRNEAGLAQPMLTEVEARLGRAPQRVLLDTKYATQADIVDLADRGITVYTPPPPDKPDAKPDSKNKRRWRRRHEPEPIKAWRTRMEDEASKPIYRRRGRVETVNGVLKGRGLGFMRVRSMVKVGCVVLLQVIAHNLWRAHGLRTASA